MESVNCKRGEHAECPDRLDVHAEAGNAAHNLCADRVERRRQDDDRAGDCTQHLRLTVQIERTKIVRRNTGKNGPTGGRGVN